MVDIARLKYDLNGMKILRVNFYQIVSAKNRGNGEKNKNAKSRDAKLPMPLKKQKRSKDREKTVFRQSDKCKQEYS